MDKVHAINARRIQWCCQDYGITQEQLSQATGIAPQTLAKVLQGEPALTTLQLQKLATYFNRGLLFFLEAEPVQVEQVQSVQFRTLANQKPALSPRLRAFIERVERQRQIYVGLLEDLGESAAPSWYPEQLALAGKPLREAAAAVREWLGLQVGFSFQQIRRAVEQKQLLVIVSNGYQGRWQIAKESPIRGFSLHFDSFPVIAIKKQASEGAQAFTLLHELAHLLLHRASVIDDEDDFYSHRQQEREANAFAGLVLVPDEFVAGIDLRDFPFDDVHRYESALAAYCRQWAVSTEVVLRRLLDSGRLPEASYNRYREWKHGLPIPEEQSGGMRYRYQEPVKVFGEPFVGAVLDALHSKLITLARASTYLDNLKIKDLRRLEDTHVLT